MKKVVSHLKNRKKHVWTISGMFILMSFILSTSCIHKDLSPASTPNIVLIMADDLGYGDISCYGSTTIKTPNIDLLSKDGIKFSDFHSNGSVCSPTRAALMTGKYQQRTGVEGVVTAKKHRHVGLGLEEMTIAEEFKKHGYNCGMFGKWHLGYAKEYNPILQGFDEFVGYVSGNVDYHSHIDQEGFLDWWKGDNIENEEGYTTDLITEYGVKYIKENNPKKTNKPFFLYLPHEAPHSPFQNRRTKGFRKVGEQKVLNAPKDSIPHLYKDMVEIMDEGIGKIVQTLKDVGQYENTILIFLSDNGAAKERGNNGMLKGYKGGPYEGGSRVPAIICYPGKIKKGLINHQVVLTMDIMPTLLDFIGKKPSDSNIDGISIKENLINQTQLPKRDVFYAHKRKSFIRSGDWKLIKLSNNSSNSVELYNLANDVQEKNELSSNYPELVNGFKKRLESWEKEVRIGAKEVSN